ncbi:MAG: protein-glutamate O-methyltransferase CheR [Alicyclobacillaceae bacterium]|nr:protein-glutamate O-methyltransferase CheR [Alicyclobacillaceae bacterium]
MDEFEQFMIDFLHLTGIDLSLYKRPQMERRLTSLRNQLGCDTYPQFAEKLSLQPEWLHRVLDKMTINVSEFFRNRERWTMLSTYIFKGPMTHPFRFWSAACSTGEEPYSLRILASQAGVTEVDLLATDIDSTALSHARQGIYQQHQLREVTKSELAAYFQKTPVGWQINREIAESVHFQQHNLLSDPYPSALDLIICRNVLIYFTDGAKHHVISEFAKALRTGGLLFLGSTEQLLHAKEYSLYPVAPFLYQKLSTMP